MEKRSWDKNLILVFQILFIIFCLICSVFSISSFTIGFDILFPGHDSAFYDLIFDNKIKSLAIFGVWLVIGFLIYQFVKDRYLRSSRPILSSVILLALLTFITRAFIIFTLGNAVSPVSDFANSWLMTKGETFYLSHYRFFPAYINYAVFMRLIARFFNYQYISILWSDVLISSLTTVGIYFLAKEIYDNDFVSITAGLIYAMYPPAILYTAINTPEHLCVLAMVWGLYFFVLALKHSNPALNIIFALSFGILAGISNSMKSFYPIVLVAVIITLFFYLVACKWKQKRIVITILILVAIIGAEILTMKGISTVSGKLFDMEINYSDAFPHFVMVGLNRQGEGQIDLGEISRTYNDLIESGIDSDTAKSAAFGVMKQDWKGHLNEVPSFVVKKLIWGFQDDCSPSRLLNASIKTDRLKSIGNKIWTPLSDYSKEVSQLFYCLLCVAALLSAILKIKSKNPNLKEFFLELVVFGYFCLILLSEAQSRYKCLVIPYIIILVASLNKKRLD